MTLKQATLTDTVTGMEHNLASLVINSINSKVFIGRDLEHNHIVLGKEPSRRQTEALSQPKAEKVLEDKIEELLKYVSKFHAELAYDPKSRLYLLEDYSTNGTEVKRGEIGTRLKAGEIISLQNKDEVFFARYGPLVYEEQSA